MLSGYSCSENIANGTISNAPGLGVIKANFPTVAANLYNAAPLPAALHGQRVLPAYQMLERNGTKIAVIGITASIVPQQADTFNITFRFTQGVEELPGLIEKVKDWVQNDRGAVRTWPVAEHQDRTKLRRHRRDVFGAYPRSDTGCTAGAKDECYQNDTRWTIKRT